MNDWNIQSRAHACLGCGRAFSDQQPYHTALFDRKHDVQRLDLCEDCWRNEHGEDTRDRQGFISHWQGIFAIPPAAPPEAIRKENAETLLRKIVELHDPQHTVPVSGPAEPAAAGVREAGATAATYAAAAYILAAKLERQRVLKVKEQFQRDGRRFFVYEHVKTAEVFTIGDPGLQLKQLDQVQRDVAALLDHGLNPPPVAAAAAQVAAGTDAEAETDPDPPSSRDVAAGPTAEALAQPLAH